MTNDPPFRLAVTRSFTARHFLTVPNPGPEGEPHSHDYRLEVIIEGHELDQWGYLVDIDRLDARLDDIEDAYAGRFLNDLEPFRGENPSVERFARLIASQLIDDIDTTRLATLEVRLWEDEFAWASYRTPLVDE